MAARTPAAEVKKLLRTADSRGQTPKIYAFNMAHTINTPQNDGGALRRSAVILRSSVRAEL